MESLGIAVVALGVLWVFGLLSIHALALLMGSVSGSWVAVEQRLYERGFEYRNLSVIETLSHFGGHAFTVGGALLGWGPIVLYLRQLVSHAGKLAGLASVGALRPIPVRVPTLSDVGTFYREARGLWADGVVAQAFERAVILVVGAITGERVTGYFFQARRLAMVPHQLLQPLTFRMAFNYFSREESRTQRYHVLTRGLAAAFLGLSAGAGVAALSAEALIPWLLGEPWRPVVPLFVGMVGVMVGVTTFTSLQAYHMAVGRMRRFLLVARLPQYLMFLGATLLAIALGTSESRLLAWGLSASFVVPSGLLWMYLHTATEEGK